MHGTGNDFILTEMEEIQKTSLEIQDLARLVCERHRGVGADGLMFHMPSSAADIRMKYYNSDGSKAEMCGNGIRCFARYVHENGWVRASEFSVETDAGIYKVSIGEDYQVEVDMGSPILDPAMIPAIGGTKDGFFKEKADTSLGSVEISSLRMGVPHTVVFQEEAETFDVEETGSCLEHMKEVFPEGTNVNFVEVLSPEMLRVDTWERGAGRTLSCGTGVCASVYMAHLFGMVGSTVEARVPGGALFIRIEGDRLFMKGAAVLICEGDFHI